MDLEDININHHEYFTRVYNKEKVKILALQIELVDYLIGMITDLEKENLFKF